MAKRMEVARDVEAERRGPARPVATALLVLALGWSALFAPELFAHRAFVAGDATSYRRFAEYSSERWRDTHTRTFWNPYVFLGLPSAGSLADARPQYLPDPLLDAWEALSRAPWTPPLWAPLLAHLAGTLGMALLARALWGCGVEGMLWAGIGWGLLPSLLVPLAFGHDAQVFAAALIPVPLLLAHHVFAARDRPRAAQAALALAVVLGVQILAGHPQMVLAGGALLASFAIERAWRFRAPRRLMLTGAAAALGLALGAAVWWPALCYGALSVRGGPGGVAASEVERYSVAFRDLVSLVWPRAVGFGGPAYWGGMGKTDYPPFAGTLVSALALLAWPRRRGELGPVLWLAGAGACGVLLALGAHLGALDHWLRAALPVFAGFRVASVWLILTQFALVLASALGLERATRAYAASRVPRRALGRMAGAAALGTLAGLCLATFPLRDGLAALSRQLHPGIAPDVARAAASAAGLDLAWRGLLLGGAAAAWLLSRDGTARRWPLPLALALHALDLASVSVPFLVGTQAPAARLAAPPPPALARVAAADPRARALPLDPELVSTNDWIAWRARSATGVHGAVDRAWSDLFAAGLPSHYEALCALAVRYAEVERGTRGDPEVWTVVDSSGPRSVIRLTHARPRAYCVPWVSAAVGDEDARARLFAPDFRADREAVAEAPDVAGAYPGSGAARVRWIEDAPDRLRLDVVAGDRAFLVVADPLLPGWTARVDGADARLVRVDDLVRGVALPAGSHRVEMRYAPVGWSAGAAVTRGAMLAAALAALLLALGPVVAWSARRRDAAPASGRRVA
jgi:hypothetical protein